MYGYFQPEHAQLNHSEQQIFESHYCRLCYCLWGLGGQLSRFLTSFDLTVYSIIFTMATGEKSPPYFPCERLKTKNKKYFKADEVGTTLGSLAFVALQEKTRDDILDENSAKAKFVRFLFKKPMQVATEAYPRMAELALNATTLVDEKQNNRESLDDILSVYGDMLADIFDSISPIPEDYKDLYRALGKWSFFIDMLCDYADDYKEGKYNYFKTEGVPTLKEYFNTHYVELIAINNQISGGLFQAINKVKNDSLEWRVVYKILRRGITAIVPLLVEGKFKNYNYCKAKSHQFKQRLGKKSNFI